MVAKAHIRASQILCCFLNVDPFVDNTDDFFTISNVKIARGKSFKHILPNSRVDARADFFSVRIINIWNRLSDEIVNASISSFYYKLVKPDYSFAIIRKHKYSIIIILSLSINTFVIMCTVWRLF